MGIILVGFALGLKMGFEQTVLLSVYYHHSLIFFLWAITFVFIMVYFLSLMKLESNPLNIALLSFMGKEVTLVYIIQWILIGNLAAWTGKEFMQAGHLIWSIGIILATVLLAFIFSRMKKDFENNHYGDKK